jgi:hypothetical protein
MRRGISDKPARAQPVRARHCCCLPGYAGGRARSAAGVGFTWVLLGGFPRL